MAKNGFSMSNRVAVLEATDDVTLTANDCGKTIILNDGTNGLVVTLPKAADAGAGWNIKLVVAESAASAKTYKISTQDTELYVGGVAMVSDEAAAEVQFFSPNGTSNDHINLTDETKGGQVGSRLSLVTDGEKWYVDGVLHGAGIIVTPFADS